MAPVFVPVAIAGPAPSPAPAASAGEPERARRAGAGRGLIEIDLRGGHRIRVDARVDGDALGRVLDALARR